MLQCYSIWSESLDWNVTQILCTSSKTFLLHSLCTMQLAVIYNSSLSGFHLLQKSQVIQNFVCSLGQERWLITAQLVSQYSILLYADQQLLEKSESTTVGQSNPLFPFINVKGEGNKYTSTNNTYRRCICSCKISPCRYSSFSVSEDNYPPWQQLKLTFQSFFFI